MTLSWVCVPSHQIVLQMLQIAPEMVSDEGEVAHLRPLS
jgi:hypothetical protein